MSKINFIQLVATYSNTPLKTGTEDFVQGNFMRLLPKLKGIKTEYVVEYIHDGILGEAKVLIDDSLDYIAPIDLASIFKYQQMGTVVGRETYHPDSFSGNITAHALPNPGLIFANSVTILLKPGGTMMEGM
ncbi:MAG: hypothetical protein ACLFQE_05010 [Thermotogota bacterium]